MGAFMRPRPVYGIQNYVRGPASCWTASLLFQIAELISPTKVAWLFHTPQICVIQAPLSTTMKTMRSYAVEVLWDVFYSIQKYILYYLPNNGVVSSTKMFWMYCKRDCKVQFPLYNQRQRVLYAQSLWKSSSRSDDVHICVFNATSRVFGLKFSFTTAFSICNRYHYDLRNAICTML